jgi:two-component sensor histidine kinase
VEHSTDLGSYGGQHPDGRPFAADDYPIVRALKTGEIVRGEQIRYRRPCGHLADLDVHAGPVRAADGTILAAVGMAFDVTDRAEAQRRLHDSEARARAAAEHLQDALAAREVLMHEADHRIKNSLQLVVALLRLQIGRVADADAKAALNAAIARVNAIGDAHLALQRSPDLRTIEVGRMLDDLCLRLGALNPDVTVTCQAEDALALDAEQAIPLGLIASELVTNALRHAFPPGTSGTVSLTVTRGEGWLEMVVADGGVGLPAAPLRPGLGSTVVQTLARQIGGVVVTESGPGKGTVVKVKISASFL